MGKPLLVIAISDESYLSPLVVGLAVKLYETADIEVISDTAYFEEFFTCPRKIDLLITDETFHRADLKCHSIQRTVVLSEEMAEDAQEDCNTHITDGRQVAYIFKYLNLPVLISSIIPREWIEIKTQGAVTQIIAVTAAEGGAGCTTVAMGIAACLKQSLKRVLFVSARTLQDFQSVLQNRTPLSIRGCSGLRAATPKVYYDLKQEIQKEWFSFLPALPSSRYSLNITEKSLGTFLQAAQKSGEYDAIIVDIGNELTPGNIELLDLASKVLVITRQAESSAAKLEMLLHNINCSDSERFHFVCNQYDMARSNALTNGAFSGSVKIEEYISEFKERETVGVKELAKNSDLQKIAYALM